MRLSLIVSLVALSLLASSAGATGASAGTLRHAHRRHVLTRAHGPRRGRDLAHMDLTPRVLLVRPYDQNITAPRQFAFGRTVSRQITAGGPVGAVGLVHFSGSDALQSGAVGNGIASRASLPTQRVGVNLSYGFK